MYFLEKAQVKGTGMLPIRHTAFKSLNRKLNVIRLWKRKDFLQLSSDSLYFQFSSFIVLWNMVMETVVHVKAL